MPSAREVEQLAYIFCYFSNLMDYSFVKWHFYFMLYPVFRPPCFFRIFDFALYGRKQVPHFKDIYGFAQKKGEIEILKTWEVLEIVSMFLDI